MLKKRSLSAFVPYLLINGRLNLGYVIQDAKRHGKLREIRGGIGFTSGPESTGGDFIDLNYLHAISRMDVALSSYIGINPGVTYGKLYQTSNPYSDKVVPYLQGEMGFGTGYFLLKYGVKFDISVNIGTLGFAGVGGRLAYVWKSNGKD